MKKLSLETIYSWLISILSFVVYLLCIPKSITFWDSPEFVLSNYTLQSTHPPGAPFYMLIANIVTGFFGTENAAFASTILSALFASLTIKFLFDVIYIISENGILKKKNPILSLVAATVGALSFAFSYSFWTSATETEVYTLSFLLLIFIFWLALHWFYSKTDKKEKQYLLLIFFFLGISMGVHLITIAIVFPLTIVFFYKKIGFTLKHILVGLIAGIFAFFFLFNIVFQGIINLAYKTDFHFVNTLSFPVNQGALFCLIAIILALLLSSYFTQKRQFIKLHYAFLCILLFIIGSTSYITPIIRSQVNPPISNAVKTTLALKNYVQATQFGVGKIPLLKGPVYNAPLDAKVPFLDAPPTYKYDEISKKYTITDDGKQSVENFDNRFNLFFPRVYHQNKINATGYKTWATIKGEPIQTSVNNELVTLEKPRFRENIAFFFNYQVNWHYLRYLFKNFIGNQNTFKGTGNITKGNWKSGFNFIDKNRLGDDSLIPEFYKNQNSSTSYFYLPFILGVIGLFFLRKHKLFFIVTFLLFATFGLGIILYVNPVPKSILIRERDYIFTASFMFFSIWIGLAVIAIAQFINKKLNHKTNILLASVLCFIVSPLQLLCKNFDNQNRNKEIFAYELGKAYLKECPEQAILITNTDNFTFPLWYLQEVENFRTDVRVINYDQLLLPWYVDKLTLKANSSLPLEITIPTVFNTAKTNLTIPLKKQTNDYLNIKNIATFLNAPSSKLTWKQKEFYALPTDNFLLPITSDNFNIKEKLNSKKIDTLRWTLSKETFQKNDLIIFDIIASNIDNRPICFAETGDNNPFGLSNFLVNKGMFHQLIPLKRNQKDDNPKIVDTDIAYKNFIESTPFTKLNNTDSKITDENIGISRNIIRRTSYFLAQALLEEGDTIKAQNTIAHTLKTTPNKTIPFQEFAFALGKLYYRTNNFKKGNEICSIAIQNIEDEIKWIISFNPPRAIINVRYLNRMLKIYEGMILQSKEFDTHLYESKKQILVKLQHQTKIWQKVNWPY